MVASSFQELNKSKAQAKGVVGNPSEALNIPQHQRKVSADTGTGNKVMMVRWDNSASLKQAKLPQSAASGSRHAAKGSGGTNSGGVGGKPQRMRSKTGGSLPQQALASLNQPQ